MQIAQALLAVAALLAAAPVRAQPPAKTPPKFALLVGCTEYPESRRIRTLRGPANDVKMWDQTLTKNFAFPDVNVIKLVGWDENDEKTRPTLKNIQAAFEALIAKAEPGSQVVIALSGHGTQVPLPKDADPLDPKNFEPDGLDEVFLPADVKPADKDGQIPNSFKDDDMGRYLNRLRDKGAHVVVVFDCCHSGTMTRGAPGDGPNEPRVVSRTASPDAIGITDQQMADSIERAKKAVAEQEKKNGKPVVAPTKVAAAPDKSGGSLVAFYGAQPFEEAPEMILPDNKPTRREFFHGLLTYTLNTAMTQRQAELTYADLAQILASQYRAYVGVKGPVPYAEGDLDRQVFGYNVWPKTADLVLNKTKDGPTVSAGALRGITTGSILAVYPPTNDARDPKTVLGYLKVTDATVASATVEPCEFDKKPAAKIDDLPDLARLTVAARDYGDLRVKLFVHNHPALKAALTALGTDDDGKEVLAMVRLVEKETEADWSLRVVTPKQATEEFGFKEVTEDQVFLIRAAGREVLTADREAANKILAATGKPLARRVYSDYAVGEAAKGGKPAADLAGGFVRDLPKIFRWQNLWRVAGETANARGNSYGVKFEVARQPGPKAKGPGEVLRGAVPNNSVLDFRVKNEEGKQSLWVVAVYMTADLQIAVYDVVAVQAGKSVDLNRGRIQAKPGWDGTEGMVLFLLPQSEFATKPNFGFLTQTPLRVNSKGPIKDDKDEAPKTPFGSLLKSSVLGPGTRDVTPLVDTTPGIVSGSWVVLP